MKTAVLLGSLIFSIFTPAAATARTWDLCPEKEMDRGCFTHRGHPMDPYPRCVCSTFKEVSLRFIASGAGSIAWPEPEKVAVNEMNKKANQQCQQNTYSGAF